MILQLTDVSKTYPSTENAKPISVLSNLNLEVEKGATVAVVGQSGCGKSTLLTLIAGLDIPDTGDVILNDQSFSTLTESKLAQYRSQQIGIVFQQFHLMPHLTALENISLPLDLQRVANAVEQSEQMLEMVGLTSRKNHFPHQLSGGECQRVAIARALVIRPTLLLADEPTGNLDEKTGLQLSDLLFELVDSIGMTLLLVTHNQALANRCGRIVTLRDGGLHADII